MWIEILKAFLALGLMGLLLGVVLYFAGNAFDVKAEKDGEKKAGNEDAVSSLERQMVAHIRCHGSHEFASKKYVYYGMNDCAAAERLLGGYMTCQYGCLGFGNCLKKCPNRAIFLRNGVAVVNRELCSGCGICLAACPKGVIELIPADSGILVDCSNNDKGARTRQACNVGCIGCKNCERNCPTGAITVTGNVAKIDYNICIHCGACAENCPRKIIRLAETSV